MNLIIPMAGWGSRLRPHTLTVPKPMISIAGKSIVERLIINIDEMLDEKLDSISFIIREDFGKKIEEQLIEIGKKYTNNPIIYYQNEPLGTGHAILCAKDSLKGNTVVGFADTMFLADFKINPKSDAVIWVKEIPNPEAFGVVKLNAQNEITEFVEKPKEFVSNLAIIGIYYFKDGENLRSELQYLIDNNIKEKGEYQLTNAMENMRKKGKVMTPGTVDLWLDCGNKNATVDSNQEILKLGKENQIHPSVIQENSVIIPPCFIDQDAKITNSVIGPYVSIGAKTEINQSVIANSMIQSETKIDFKILTNSMIGSHVELKGTPQDLSVGDYNQIKN